MTAAGWRRPLAWLGALLALYLTVPLVAFLIRLAGSGHAGFGVSGLGSALAVSVEASTVSLALITVLGVPLAYVLAHHRGRLARAAGLAVQLPLALPPVMSGIVLIYLVGPYTFLGRLSGDRLTETVAGVVLAQSFVAAPFLVVSARSAFRTVDPALDDLAATLGHRPVARFLRIHLPVAGPGIRAGMILAWLRAFGEYGATVILAYHPFSLPIYTANQFAGYGLPTTQAPTVLALLVAAAGIAVGNLRVPRRLRRRPPVPAPEAPVRGTPTPVGFDLRLALGPFSLRLGHRPGGHRLAVLGPSGSGKSVTLRCLAGLYGPAAGTVTYGGTDVGHLPPEGRRIGYVPQGLGLIPGRDVWRQVTFGVGARPARAAWWLDVLHLGDLVERRPEQLSGGQRQRVSLARALAADPAVVLLDEPFSALDAPVRDELVAELRRLQREAGLSTVLVTHDPEEAAMLADEVLVVDGGRVLQAGPCAEVFTRPASPEVARLLGVENVRAGTAAAGGVRVGPVDGPAAGAGTGVLLRAPAGLAEGTGVLWRVRPDRVSVSPAGSYPAVVEDVVVGPAGPTASLRLLSPAASADLGPGGEVTLTARSPSVGSLRAGQPCRVDLDPADVSVWAPGAPARAAGERPQALSGTRRRTACPGSPEDAPWPPRR